MKKIDVILTTEERMAVGKQIFHNKKVYDIMRENDYFKETPVPNTYTVFIFLYPIVHHLHHMNSCVSLQPQQNEVCVLWQN